MSTVKITDFNVAAVYTKSPKKWSRYKYSDEELAPSAKQLIEEDFEVLYGIKPRKDSKFDMMWRPGAAILGHAYGAKKPDPLLSQGASVDIILKYADLDEISAIFVPARKVKAVEDMIHSAGLSHSIAVSPFEPIEASLRGGKDDINYLDGKVN